MGYYFDKYINSLSNQINILISHIIHENSHNIFIHIILPIISSNLIITNYFLYLISILYPSQKNMY
jgi:hypothetical protein